MAKIVVGVEDHPDAPLGLAWALERAARTGDELEVIHAWSEHLLMEDALTPYTGLHSDMVASADALVTQTLGYAHKMVSADHVSVRENATPGSAVEVLTKASAGASLVVLTRLPLSRLRRALRGSVSTAVIAHSRAPVAVIPSSYQAGTPTHRVVVALDHSPAAQYALEWAVAEARSLGVVLVPVFVATPGLELSAAGESLANLEAAERNRMSSNAPDDVQVLPEILLGDPSEEISRFLRPDDLLVTGTRALSGPRGWLLGSTSAHLVKHAPCPLVVVRIPRS